MSGTGEVLADFAGEERAFRIRLGEIRRIEAKCDTGIGEILRRLSRCVYFLAKAQDSKSPGAGIEAVASGLEIRADDVRETIYQGLIGSGMSSADATKLVRQEIDERGVRGLLDNAGTAFSVLWGANETPPGEPQAGESPATPPNPSTSPTSTEPAPPSD